jgi:adenylate cyclase
MISAFITEVDPLPTKDNSRRLEEVAKVLMKGDEESVVLVSEVVVRCVGTVWSAEPVGRPILRGRHEATTIYRLR